MIIDKMIKQRFDDDKIYLDRLSLEVKKTLLPFCERRGYAFISRIKSLESVAEKVETGRYSSWDNFDDLFATSIIIPNLLDESEVITFISQVFDIQEIKKRGSTKKSPDIFRFDSTRVISKMKDASEAGAKIYTINFEIQIRSAFEHAWSSATHSLVYKSNTVDWNALRLAAQIKASVEQLDMLIAGFLEVNRHITSHDWPELSRKIKIANFFKEKVDFKIIPDDFTPKDYTRFSENLLKLLQASKSWSKNRGDDIVSHALQIIDSHLKQYSDHDFPRSLSLFQLCFSILITKDEVTLPLNKYTPLISDEMLDLFPDLKQKRIKNRFSFN